MSDAFDHRYADVNQIRLHYVTAGTGPAVVLIHGWPQTWYEWRKVIPALAERYTVVAPDMRGLGQSSAPGTEPGNGYDKKSVANDIWRLMHDELGHTRFFVVGHDWGGPVAYRLAADHPEAITKLVILDVVIPGDRPSGAAFAGPPRWHHLFHQVRELPEALVEGREDIYLNWFYRAGGHTPDAIPEEDRKVYIADYKRPGAMHAGFEYYRALRQDTEDNRETVARFKLPMPVLALGGGGNGGRGSLTSESLARVAKDVTGGSVPEAGHWIPEEQPDYLVERLFEFFSDQAS